jgi:hypothetical protein
MLVRKTPNFKTLITALATVAMMLAFVPAAFAASSSVDVYGGSGGKVVGVEPNTPSDEIPSEKTVPESNGAKAKGEALSFTGLNVALILGAGLLLVGVGYSTRRLTLRPQQ